MPDVISHIQTFRDYFHYHIKASKVRLIQLLVERMSGLINGRRISTLVCDGELPTSSKVGFALLGNQGHGLTNIVLRRARPENEEKERKTASGRTFKVSAA